MTRVAVRFSLLCVLCVVACGDDGATPAHVDAGFVDALADASTTATTDASTTAALKLAIHIDAVPAGAEAHVCTVVPLPNAATGWIKSIHAKISTGSHHLIVDRKPMDTPLMDKPTVCSPTMGGDSTRLLIAQQPDTVLDLPNGTGLRIEAHQPIFLQLHYINQSSKVEDISGTVELELFDASAGAPIEAQSLFAGATSISLPQHQAGMAQYFYMPPASVGRPLHAFAVTSHTHSLGVDATIERVSSADAPTVKPLHESTDWSEPPLTRFDPALTFDGSDGVRLRCRYQNDTDHDVSFGTRFQDEMCFMWFYFYFDDR